MRCSSRPALRSSTVRRWAGPAAWPSAAPSISGAWCRRRRGFPLAGWPLVIRPACTRPGRRTHPGGTGRSRRVLAVRVRHRPSGRPRRANAHSYAPLRPLPVPLPRRRCADRLGRLSGGAAPLSDAWCKLAPARSHRGERPMAAAFQLVIDCTDPDRLAHFWAAALRYELEPPRRALPVWDDYWRDAGVPEQELGTGADCIIDPDGRDRGSGSRSSRSPRRSRAGSTSTSMPAAALTRDQHALAPCRGRGTSAGRSWRHPDRCPAAGRARPLRRRHEGPRRQRVRYLLIMPLVGRSV